MGIEIDNKVVLTTTKPFMTLEQLREFMASTKSFADATKVHVDFGPGGVILKAEYGDLTEYT